MKSHHGITLLRHLLFIVGFVVVSACSDAPSEQDSSDLSPQTSPQIDNDSTPAIPDEVDTSNGIDEATAAQDETKHDPSEASSVVETSLYTVVDGQLLDSDTYRGFIVHRNMCARCHGSFGQGMIGANLAESLVNLSREDFESIVANGRNAMPPHSGNTQVMEALDNLYAYYKARADGAIGEVRPRVIE